MVRLSIAEIAARQLADYDARRPGAIFAEAGFSLSVEEAFAVQRQVALLRAARGEAIAGYKIGCVSQAVQRQLGIDHPVFGHLFASEVHRSGAALDPGAYTSLAIEGELAVRLDDGLAIAAVFPVIELHNALFRGAGPAAPELIANNAIHSGVVLPWAETGSAEGAISVFRNGELLGTSGGGGVPGGPAASVAKVAGHLASQGLALQPGMLVLTGSPLPLYPVSAGDRIAVHGPGAAAVELLMLPVRRDI